MVQPKSSLYYSPINEEILLTASFSLFSSACAIISLCPSLYLNNRGKFGWSDVGVGARIAAASRKLSDWLRLGGVDISIVNNLSNTSTMIFVISSTRRLGALIDDQQHRRSLVRRSTNENHPWVLLSSACSSLIVAHAFESTNDRSFEIAVYCFFTFPFADSKRANEREGERKK